MEECRFVSANDRTTRKPGEPIPEDLERAIKAMWEAEFEYDDQLQRHRFLIEGNIRVLNAQSTIEGVRKDYGTKFISFEALCHWKRIEELWAEFSSKDAPPL